MEVRAGDRAVLAGVRGGTPVTTSAPVSLSPRDKNGEKAGEKGVPLLRTVSLWRSDSSPQPSPPFRTEETGDWTFLADVRWHPEPQRRTPERCLAQAGCWPAAASGNPARGHLRLRFVPEARKKLAGGGAQRNHRINCPEETCAPAGRESRGTPPTRLALATLHHGRTSRAPGNPVGVRRPGAERGRVRRGGERCRRAFTALAPRRGARLGWGGGSGGSAALHHRLISYVPPARRGRGARNAAGTERKCPNSSLLRSERRRGRRRPRRGRRELSKRLIASWLSPAWKMAGRFPRLYDLNV